MGQRTKAAILFLIFCLQFQAAAAIVMPCAHQDPSAENKATASLGCHQTTDDPADDGNRSHFSCVKCALSGITVGFQAPMPSLDVLSVHTVASLSPSFQTRHFYRFTPALPQRPPIV